jgi:hypothetical protein
MRRRGEMVERSFAHVLDRGGMRRAWLRGRQNVHKRYLSRCQRAPRSRARAARRLVLLGERQTISMSEDRCPPEAIALGVLEHKVWSIRRR